MCLCVYTVRTVCNAIRFKAPNTRCCIMNALSGVHALWFCLYVSQCICVCSNTHLASQQTTAHWSIWASLQCILQRDNPPLPRPLPPSASQLSLNPHLHPPRISPTMPTAPKQQPAGVVREPAKLPCPSLLMPSLPRRPKSLGYCWLVHANPQI